MASSMGFGFATVFAVSGSVVLLAVHAHRRLLSDFMKQFESQLPSGSVKCRSKRKAVRFARDATVPLSSTNNSKEFYCKKKLVGRRRPVEKNIERVGQDSMPLNRKVLYKGLIEYRALSRAP